MSFEHRHRARQATLIRLIALFQAIAIGYLAMHLVVAWFGYRSAGLATALGIFLTLGVGDLYWAFEAWRATGVSGETLAALAAAVVCFVSWLTRPAFNRWAARFQDEMLADASDAIAQEFDAAAARIADDTERDGVGGPPAAPR